MAKRFSTTYHILLAVTFLLFTSCIKEDAKPEDNFSLKAGDMLPTFSLTNATGTISDKDLSGSVSLIVFFNTNCKDCQRALPDIQKIYQEYTEKEGFKMILVAREETEDEVNSYFTKHQISLPYYIDPIRKVYSLFAKSTIPRFYLSGKDKKIVMVQATELDKKILTSAINQLLTSDTSQH